MVLMDELQFGPYKVEVTHPDKVLFPDDDLTKGDLINYYRDIASVMLPHVTDRPLTLRRFPDGLGDEGFYQHRRGDYFPDWLASVRAPRAGGEEVIDHILCNNQASLVYLANQATITFHCWLSRTPKLRQPDRLIFDLDPADGEFEPVRQAARLTAGLMREVGLSPHVMTTGSRGVHVVAPLKPLRDFDAVRELAKDMASLLAAAHPQTLTNEQRKERRAGRIYLDVMRNAYGQTAVAPYSVRSKAGAPVATPLDWDELGGAGLTSQQYRMTNIFQRLGQKTDPWKDIYRHRVDVDSARKKLAGL
jgi:bifunctional non-homologous end joining protein LigD